jgi:hypothetical protein
MKIANALAIASMSPFIKRVRTPSCPLGREVLLSSSHNGVYKATAETYGNELLKEI